MIAYKFRSPAQIEFTLDILFNNRLFCADWSRMNDPMEGYFAYSHTATDEADLSKQLDEIVEEKKRIKICSLSKTFDCHLLWAHYADGFSGIAIEVELPDTCVKVREVKYRGVFASVSLTNARIPEHTAREILSSKYLEWKYEQEVRILNNSEWYQLESPVRRIIVGHRMNPSLFEGLRIICKHRGIKINRTGIGDEGIDADHVDAIRTATKKIAGGRRLNASSHKRGRTGNRRRT